MFLVQDGFIIPQGAGECPNGHPPTSPLFQGNITPAVVSREHYTPSQMVISNENVILHLPSAMQRKSKMVENIQ